jgi:hypothetical protein
MLFILAMELLQRLMEIATEHHILSPLQFRAARIRASLCADDAVLFVNPLKEDIIVIQQCISSAMHLGCALILTNMWHTPWHVMRLI